MNVKRLFEKAVSLFIDTSGTAETRQFTSIIKNKRMESVKRHRLWQSKLDEEKFLDEIFGPGKYFFVSSCSGHYSIGREL